MMSVEGVICPSCGSRSVVDFGEIPASCYFAGRKLAESLPAGSLFRCESCWLYFRYPRLDNEILDQLYEKGASDNWQHITTHREDWVTASDWIKCRGRGNSVLDVGCFDGGFLSQLGERYELSGIEIHTGAALAAEQKGIQIVASSYRSLGDIEKKFDIVTSFDVIEHVDDPLFFIEMLSSVVRPGGMIIISTGNTEAPSWRFMGSRYWYCSISEHISFINPKWCEIVSTKLGFQLETIKTFPHLKTNTLGRFADFGKNIFYRLAPNMVAWMRERGFGGIDITADPYLAHYPPNWLSSSDHFMALFRK